MKKHCKQCVRGDLCKQCRQCRQCKQFTRQCYSISDGRFSIIVIIIIMTKTIIPPPNRSASWLQTSRRSTAPLRTTLNQGGFTFTFRKMHCLLLLHWSARTSIKIFYFLLACILNACQILNFVFRGNTVPFLQLDQNTLQILPQLFICRKLCLISSMFNTWAL